MSAFDFTALMETYGRRVQIQIGSETPGAPFGAFIRPLRYKNKMYLGGVNTRIGFDREGYYLYLGPPAHDLTAAVNDLRILTQDGDAYTVDRAESIFVGDTVSHIWAILRSVVV